MSKEIYIIGAGPAGMACAMELSKAGETAHIIEKDTQVGGLAQTLEFKEDDGLVFRTDIGPHRFFSKNQYLYDFIEDLLGEEWRTVNRQTRQLIEGKFYDYPIDAKQAFKNIGLIRAVGMGLSYGVAKVQYGLLQKEIKSFEDYIVANFGKALGDFNMLNYSEKIWGIPCTQIDAEWAKQRIKGLSLTSALKDALSNKKGKDSPKSLVDIFYYPQFGTGNIYNAIADKVQKNGFDIELNCQPTKFNHDGKKITSFTIKSKDGEKEVQNANQIVSSVAPSQMLKMLNPAPPQEIVDAAESLMFRSQVYLFVTLDKEKVTDDNWIYIPNLDVPFGRVAEMRNFSKDMSPEGKTSLFIEYFVTYDDEIWNMSKEELFEKSMPFFEEYGLFTRDEVRNCYRIERRFVYPVYDIDYQTRIKKVLDYLDSFENLLQIGRPGRFRYTNQDHSLEMGIMAARKIVDDQSINLDEIGSENEYFEKGYVKTDNSN
jgi:protoporphyrinogen oxidase